MGCCDCFGLGVKIFSRKALRFETILRTVAVKKMRDVFRLVARMEQRQILSPHKESNLRPSD